MSVLAEKPLVEGLVLKYQDDRGRRGTVEAPRGGAGIEISRTR